MPANPKKNDFLNLDELEAEATLAPFTIRLGGKKYEVPNASSLSVEDAEALDGPGRRSVVAEHLGQEPSDLLWKMSTHTFNKFLEAWLAHSGTSLGEGEASTDS